MNTKLSVKFLGFPDDSTGSVRNIGQFRSFKHGKLTIDSIIEHDFITIPGIPELKNNRPDLLQPIGIFKVTLFISVPHNGKEVRKGVSFLYHIKTILLFCYRNQLTERQFLDGPAESMPFDELVILSGMIDIAKICVISGPGTGIVETHRQILNQLPP